MFRSTLSFLASRCWERAGVPVEEIARQYIASRMQIARLTSALKNATTKDSA